MKEFKTYHPLVNLTYFVLVIGFSCYFIHPYCLTASLVCGFVYSVLLKGTRAIKTNLLYMLPMLLAMAIINPAFNHDGVTILCYLPSGNPLTLESIIYGICAAAMLSCVICHFSCYNEIMTSDKLIYIFGRIIPKMSLVLSMTLRFVPRLASRLKIISNTQRCLGRDATSGGIISRAKGGLNILSILTTWSLENAIETADSMKARGYGLPGRTSFSIFTFDKRDRKALICLLLLGTYVLVGAVLDGMYIRFFPSIKATEITALGISFFVAHLLLCAFPIIIELWEVIRWNALSSKK